MDTAYLRIMVILVLEKIIEIIGYKVSKVRSFKNNDKIKQFA